MKAEFFILQVCGFLDDLGDGFYKWHGPGRALAQLPGVVFADCHPDHRFLPELLELADVVILPYYQHRDFQPVIEERRAKNKATVFDASDFIYDVEAWSPFSELCRERSVQAEFRQYIELADAVQTTTSELARRWQPWARRVEVFPHHLAEIPPLPPSRRGAHPGSPLTVGLAGSRSHYADWLDVAPILQRWVMGRQDVRLAMMANEFAKPFFQLPPERYVFKPFSALSVYLSFLNSWDIGLAPLLPTEFNRCRSDVKFLEYASRGVVGIYADLEPYRHTVVHGETGFLYRSHEELVQYLDILVGNENLRERVRRQAYEYVAKNRRIDDHIHKRYEFYLSLLPQGPHGCELSDKTLAVAVRDGNYLQFRPQVAEQILFEVSGRATRESAQKLARLLEEYPQYLVALQRMGRILNELRDHRDALMYLERALKIRPRSARTLCEMGIARYGLRDVDGARRDLEAALAINPYFYPAWDALLRLLGHHWCSGGQSLARRAEELFPECFLLALSAARTHSGLEVVQELERLVNLHADKLRGEERPKAVAAFSQTIMALAGRFMGTPELLALLQKCSAAFPDSARIADMFGHALFLAGRRQEAYAEYARALNLQRMAAAYRREFPKGEGDAAIHWLIAESLRKCRK